MCSVLKKGRDNQPRSQAFAFALPGLGEGRGGRVEDTGGPVPPSPFWGEFNFFYEFFNKKYLSVKVLYQRSASVNCSLNQASGSRRRYPPPRLPQNKTKNSFLPIQTSRIRHWIAVVKVSTCLFLRWSFAFPYFFVILRWIFKIPFLSDILYSIFLF